MECTGIALKHLGEHLDIHCGGIDNAFPHHTNEIAQSEAYLGHKWCNFWMHVYHLNTNSGKMAKSKGEFLTVSLLEEKGYNPLAYRFFCLQSHYRKGLVFTWENLDNAVAAYEKLLNKISRLNRESGDLDQDLFDTHREKFVEVVGNDLNTPMGMTAIYDVLKLKTSDKTKVALLNSFDEVLCLNLWEESQKLKSEPVISQEIVGERTPEELEIDALVQSRTDAKKAKDFALADQIRAQLKEKNIEVIDTPQGAIWKRI